MCVCAWHTAVQTGSWRYPSDLAKLSLPVIASGRQLLTASKQHLWGWQGARHTRICRVNRVTSVSCLPNKMVSSSSQKPTLWLCLWHLPYLPCSVRHVVSHTGHCTQRPPQCWGPPASSQLGFLEHSTDKSISHSHWTLKHGVRTKPWAKLVTFRYIPSYNSLNVLLSHF